MVDSRCSPHARIVGSEQRLQRLADSALSVAPARLCIHRGRRKPTLLLVGLYDHAVFTAGSAMASFPCSMPSSDLRFGPLSIRNSEILHERTFHEPNNYPQQPAFGRSTQRAKALTSGFCRGRRPDAGPDMASSTLCSSRRQGGFAASKRVPLRGGTLILTAS